MFIAKLLSLCNKYVNTFLEICAEIGIPIADEKTVWASTSITFLGMLLQGISWTISIPDEKITRTVNLLQEICSKQKAMIKMLQKLAGLLNFLGRAIFPGRAFTRRMYAKFSGDNVKHLKSFHHIKLDQEFKSDCKVWLHFLSKDYIQAVSRPFVDLSKFTYAEDVNFSSDAAGGELLGFGCIFKNAWCFGQWEVGFIRKYKPSIEFLELFALCVGVFTWIEFLGNKRILLLCDNQAVVSMVNNTSSSCKFCMILIRKLTLKCLKHNLRLTVQYIETKKNILPDLLSRLKIDRFHKTAKKMKLHMNSTEDCPTAEVWPLEQFWIDNCLPITN